MRIVIALGGNALLRRSDPMTTEVQRRNVRVAADGDRAARRPSTASSSSTATGRRSGLLALQAEAYRGAEPYPLDVLDAGTQGMIGYLIQQELRSLLPPERQVVTLLTMIVVDPADAAFAAPDQVRRARLHPGCGRSAGVGEGLDVPAGRRGLASGRALAGAAPGPGDRADHLAAGPRSRGHLRRRRRHPDHVPLSRHRVSWSVSRR